MPKRMIDPSILNSSVMDLPMGARWLLVGMITMADNQGRLEANERNLWRDCFFTDDSVDRSNVTDWLKMLADNETILLYESMGKSYAQLVNWWSYQDLTWAEPSSMPAPDGWHDRIRYKPVGGFNGVYTYNWTLKDGTRPPDTCDKDGKPTPKAIRDRKERKAAKTEDVPEKEESPPTEQALAGNDSEGGQRQEDDNTPTDDGQNGIPIDIPTAIPIGVDRARRYKIQDIVSNSNNTSACAHEGNAGGLPNPNGTGEPTADDCFSIFVDNINPMPGAMDADLCTSLHDEYGGFELDYALRQAVKANARNWRYVEKVLENRKRGYDPRQARANGAKSHANQQQTSQRGNGGGRIVQPVPQGKYPQQIILLD